MAGLNLATRGPRCTARRPQSATEIATVGAFGDRRPGRTGGKGGRKGGKESSMALSASREALKALKRCDFHLDVKQML